MVLFPHNISNNVFITNLSFNLFKSEASKFNLSRVLIQCFQLIDQSLQRHAIMEQQNIFFEIPTMRVSQQIFGDCINLGTIEMLINYFVNQ